MGKFVGAFRSRRKVVVLALLLISAAIPFFILARPPKVAPFIVLRQPVQMPRALRDRVTQWIPRKKSWAWAWRLQETVLGRRKPVTIRSQVFSFSSSSPISRLSLGPPSFFDPNGVEVWLLPSEQLPALSEKVAKMWRIESSGFGLTTSDGTEAQLTSGTTARGICILTCFPRLRTDALDLIARVVVSGLAPNGSFQTNLDVAFRLQIPKGSGVFILNTNVSDSSQKLAGILIDPPQPAK